MLLAYLKKYNFVLVAFAMICPFYFQAQSQSKNKPDTFSIQKQFAFKTLTINDGLSQNSVISIAQDSIGYLWLATQDGLNKYDGRHFTHYDKQFEDITRSTFSKLGKIYIDKQNRLWIITHSGNLELYQTKTDDFKHIKLPYSVSSIYQDKTLNMYIGTNNNGLFKIDAQTKDTAQVFKQANQDKTVYDYLETDTGLVIATSGAIYKYLNNHSYKEIAVKDALELNFSSLEKTANGTIWAGTFGSGLYYKETNQDNFVKFHHKNLPLNLNIEDILIDRKNRIWIATYGNGVYLINLNTDQVTNFTANKSNPFAIHYNDMLCLYEDIAGTIWFGSDGTGASYYDEHLIKFNILTNNQVPKNVNVDMVRSITADNEKNLWIGTSGKGLTYYNIKQNTYKTYTQSNSPLASNRIISLDFNQKDLWIGHQGYGLNIIEPSGHYKQYPQLSNYTIWKIVSASNNQSWLCTERHGILLFDKNKGIIKTYNKNNSNLTTNNIRALIKGNNNTLWIGTDSEGVFKLDRQTDTISNIEFINDKIKTLHFSDNTLWIGTNGSGFKILNLSNNTIKTYTEENGLPNDVVYGILPDNQGYLWLSTNNGICKFDVDKPNDNFEYFTVYDGLQGTEFNTGAYYMDAKGTLYFGGLEGVNWFNPDQLTYNTVKPKTIITQFEIFTKEHPIINNTEFKSNENTVTFTFSSLHFSQPDRNLFKYQLVNHDADWIESGNNNTAHYTNLTPNDYTFKVISCSYDGVWNETPATYMFTIKQPWYFSTMAIFIYILLFVILSYAIYYYLKWRWHMKMQLEFKHEETKRLKKLNKFKTRLYTNLSHEFRTPLTLITGPIENQLQNPNLSSEDRNELTLVQRNSHRLLNLVNQLLDLSRLESGNLTLSISNGNLVVLLKQLVVAFEFKAKEKKISYSYKIQPIDDAWFDPDVIEKIVSNLLANAIKYTPENGKIHFESTLQNGHLIVSIINNGNTIPDSEISKLFQRYYQNNKTTDGVGIGLSLVKELCVLSHGNIVAHTMNDDEIQFTFTLPIERSFYNASEITDDVLPFETINQPISENDDYIDSEVENGKDKPVLLIVEDDADIRIYVKSIFKNNYIIKESSNGEEGIKSAIKYIPDIIISDVMMPKVDGIELCNTLKHDQRTSHIPIILLTAKSGDTNEIKGLKTGADDYILKPFNSKKLKIRVQKLIELRQQLQKLYSNSFELNDLVTTSTDQLFFKNIKEILDKNIINPEFNAQDLSSAMLMSRMQLHRKLKALTNLATTEFIRSERLKLAKTLLAQNHSTISEIAYQVGFNSPSYFIKCFKEAYHCTPSEYASK